MNSALDFTAFERYFASRFRRRHDGAWDARRFLETLASQVVDVERLKRYAARCPVAGASPRDYAPRVVQIAPDCAVVAGIHFRGMDLNFPFVDVSAQSAPLPAMALHALAQEFRAFRPRAIRLWRAPDEPSPDAAHEDLSVVLGSLAKLLSAAPMRNANRIRLQLDPSVASYGAYRLTYEALHSASPESSPRVNPETLETLRECAGHGAFFRVVVDGELAGFVAAQPDTYRMWKGWAVVEEVLHPRFRGKGLGAAVQRALLSDLDQRVERWVFGTIASENLPSLRTAQRVGREIVEVGAFVHLNA